LDYRSPVHFGFVEVLGRGEEVVSGRLVNIAERKETCGSALLCTVWEAVPARKSDELAGLTN
jgi:hypothetical protein